MTTETLLTLSALLASAFINAVAAISLHGIRAEVKAVKELIETKIAGLEDDVEVLKNWREKFFVKGAHA